jgi:hypothetical protein
MFRDPYLHVERHLGFDLINDRFTKDANMQKLQSALAEMFPTRLTVFVFVGYMALFVNLGIYFVEFSSFNRRFQAC